MIEEWRDIEGYEGYYQVSNYGQVRSLDRWRNSGTGGYMHKGRILKQEISNCGYYMVTLSVDGRCKRYSVHRLVAQAFIPNLEYKEQVNHIDGEKSNNTVENLEWNTQSENTIHAFSNGLMVPNTKGRKVYCFETGKTYMSIAQAGRELNIDHSHIGRVCKGIYKQTKGYTFKYVD